MAMMLPTGCAEDRPVERVPVAARGNRDSRIEYDRAKPLPENAGRFDRERELPPEPPFYDAPLVNQKTPEQTQFEQGYRAVGRPRITVFINRTLEGSIMPANEKDATVRT